MWSSHQCQCCSLMQNHLLWPLYAIVICLWISIEEQIVN